MPATYDIEIEAGTSRLFVFALGDLDEDGEFVPLSNMAGAEVRLPIKWRTGEVTFSTSDDGGMTLDVEAATVSWPMSIALSRELPIGRLTRYEVEVEWSNGFQAVYLAGYIIVNRGDNND